MSHKVACERQDWSSDLVVKRGANFHWNSIETSRGWQRKYHWSEGGGRPWQESTAAFKSRPATQNWFPVPVTFYTYPSKLSIQFTSLHGYAAEQQYWFFFCFHFFFFSFHSEQSFSLFFVLLLKTVLSSARTKPLFESTHLLKDYPESLVFFSRFPQQLCKYIFLKRSTNDAWGSLIK